MVYGIGVDTVTVARMENSLKNERFMQRVFSPAERRMLEDLPSHRLPQSAAGCFAAKEAFLKATGLGIGSFPLEDIAALRRENGAPYYALTGAALAWCKQKGLAAHLSLTNEGGFSTAFAILEEAFPKVQPL